MQDQVTNLPIPGYTGHIHNLRADVGRPFGRGANAAISEFLSNTTAHACHRISFAGQAPFLGGRSSCRPPSTATETRTGLPPLVPRIQTTTSTPMDLAATTMHPPARNPPLYEQPAPYLLPGYTGHVHGLVDGVGRTYGNMTNEALTRFGRAEGGQFGEIARPNTTECTSQVHQDTERGETRFWMTRGQRAPTTPTNHPRYEVFKQVDYRIPGYTGHIPGIRSVHGHSFGDATANAMNPGVLDKVQADPRLAYNNRHALDGRRESNPIIGFTGHRKGARDLLLGRTYGETMRALAEQTTARSQIPAPQPRPVVVNHQPRVALHPHEEAEREKLRQARGKIIQDEPHIIPGYTGHVHRAKEELGIRYGEVTRRALAQYASKQVDPPSPVEKRREIPIPSNAVPLRAQKDIDWGDMTNPKQAQPHSNRFSNRRCHRTQAHSPPQVCTDVDFAPCK